MGRADERLPEGTLFRTTIVLRSAPAAAGDGPSAVGGPAELLNEVHRALAAPLSLEELLEAVLDRTSSTSGPRKR